MEKSKSTYSPLTEYVIIISNYMDNELALLRGWMNEWMNRMKDLSRKNILDKESRMSKDRIWDIQKAWLIQKPLATFARAISVELRE